ncbi:site-specific integrase [Paraburkholderia sp.]|uniref:site-specific integrase n=1 Tax=Paraburkholderia sp. TaxID=1926495 RepID=UPI0039E4B0C7
MSSKRKRGDSWEYIVKNKALLGKPYTISFTNEEEGDAWVAHLEACLRQGIVPEELSKRIGTFTFVADVITGYLKSGYVPPSDVSCLNVLNARIGTIALKDVDYPWVEKWIAAMKQFHNLAPTTIRHHVGALARCFDWGSKQKIQPLIINPIRLLPKRYATYTEADRRYLEARNAEAVTAGLAPKALPKDESRDRRLAEHEEVEARRLLAGGKPIRPDGSERERELANDFRPAYQCMFDLALETAMRMKEIYTIEVAQVDMGQRTIFLDDTKNGDKRQVPLTSVAIAALNTYFAAVTNDEPSMQGFKFDNGLLFPFFKPDPLQRREVDAKEAKALSSRLSRFWVNLFEAAGAFDLHFHDLRHEATSRLFERTRLRDTEIAKITGHKDLRMLARYANLRASALADMLW